MEDSPNASQGALPDDDLVLDSADVGDAEDGVNIPSVVSQDSGFSSPPRDEISTPSSRAVVLHVEAAPQEPAESTEVSEVAKHPSLTKEQQHHDLPSE